MSNETIKIFGVHINDGVWTKTLNANVNNENGVKYVALTKNYYFDSKSQKVRYQRLDNIKNASYNTLYDVYINVIDNVYALFTTTADINDLKQRIGKSKLLLTDEKLENLKHSLNNAKDF